MTTRFHIGAKDLRGDIGAYAKRFDLLEVHAEGAQGKAPSAATLRKWRRAVPAHFEFVVVAGSAVGKLRRNAAFEAELAEALARVTTLRARCVVIRTPPEVTPARVWRDRMKQLVGELPSDATHVVWEPSGLWELDDAAEQARTWGVVLAIDPSRDAVPDGPVTYCRLRAMGETRSFGPSALGRVAAKIGDRREAFVVIETDDALAGCKALRRLAASAPHRDGGMDRVLRPRRGSALPAGEEE